MSLLTDIINDAKATRRTGKVAKERGGLESLAPNESRGYRLPTIYASNQMFLTRKTAWAGYQIPNKPWGYLGPDERKSYFYSASRFFDRLFPADAENAGHLLVTNRVYSADEWQQALLAKAASTASPNFGKWIDHSRRAIERNEFFERETYLFARLGSRGTRDGIRGWVRDMVEMWATNGGFDDHQPDEREHDFWRQQARSTTETFMSSWLGAQPIHRRRLEWLTRHLDTLALPTPDVAPADQETWGAGEWRTVLSAETEEIELGVVGKNRYRALKIEAPVGKGVAYAAFLPLANIPAEIAYSSNWIQHAASLDFPVDTSLRFEIIDPDRAEKDLNPRISGAEDQATEDREAGVRVDETTRLQHEGLTQVKTQVRMARKPLAYWQCVFAVFDTDKDALLEKVVRLIQHYKERQFELVCPSNDQRELFYQSFPGNEILVEDWIHRTDSEYLAASMPWLTSTVGDRLDGHALYQGYTVVRDSNGIPARGVPVFFDLQNVVDDEGSAPTEADCGWPGSGKTVSRGSYVSLQDALRGVTQFIWDPKGDFLPLKKYAEEMLLDPKKVKLVDLLNPMHSVSLDVFAIAEVDPTQEIDDREVAALDVLESLCGRWVNQPGDSGNDASNLLSQAVGAVLHRERAGGVPASMQGVLDVINEFAEGDFTALEGLRQPDEKRRERMKSIAFPISDYLTTVRNSGRGRLLFRDASKGSIKVDPGDMVIFIAIGLKPTEEGQEPSRESLISDVIAGLMTDYIRSLLFRLEDHVPKAMVFDEWHVIKRSKRADALLGWLKRMGRSKRCMVRQLSQSAKDFDKGSLSTVWAGKALNEEEALASLDLLGIEKSAHHINTLKGLGPGQFLFRDFFGRVGLVQVDVWDSWLLDKLDTSPSKKAALIEELLATTPAPA